MTTQSDTFGRLLRGAINAIAAYEGRATAAVEEDIGGQIGVAGSAIQRYKAGSIPPEPRAVELLAAAAVRRGYLGRAWLARFLQAARYPQPEALIARLVGDAPHASHTLPSGTLAFLVTDIAGSTRLWEQERQAMQAALARHDQLVAQAIEAAGGQIFSTAGDGCYAAFVTAADAVDAALAIQRAAQAEPWPTSEPLRVRVAIHAGVAQLRDGDYHGPALNRVARLCSAGHGGQTLLSHAAHELARDQLPDGAALADLGEHRLRDLGRPERVFQLRAPDLLSDFPPLRALDAYRHNLPAQATPLIGREAEVAAVVTQVRRADVRLLTLVGPGGIGKTRLALQAAAELLDDYPDGVWFVDLSPIRDPGLVLTAIGAAVGVADAGERPLAERLGAYLRDRELLLVLDNVEQVAAAAPQVGELLAKAPRVAVLATSREALRIYGEREYAVPPLALPDLAKLPPLERLTQYEAVRLFIERAQAVRPGFEVTSATAPVVAEICARLDGLPLAIELAAARARIFGPEALLGRLSNRLRLLASGPRNLPGRQQTLRDAIAWSYELLSAEEQALFARLGVFAGGFTLAAAEAVCGDGVQGQAEAWRAGDNPVLRELGAWLEDAPPLQVALAADEVALLVESLLSKSLLRPVASEGEPRFTLLETIREYALERLAETGEAEAVRWRHAAHYAGALMTLPVWGNAPGLRHQQLDLGNLHALLDWSVASGQAVPGLAVLGHTEFWMEQYAETTRWMDTLLAASTATPFARTEALYTKSGRYLFSGQYALARVVLAEYYGMMAELNPANLEWQDWLYGWLDLGEGNYDLALERFERFARLSDAKENAEEWRPSAAFVLAMHAMVVEDADAAYRYLNECLEGRRAQGKQLEVANIQQKLGFVAQRAGDTARATTYLRESIELSQALGYRHMIAYAVDGFAGVALTTGDLERSARLYGAAEALQERTIGMDVDQQIIHGRNVAALRERLDAQTLAARWAEGRALDWEQAVALALATK